MSFKYNETECRKPSFQADSSPVVMADEQTWYIPKPYTELIPKMQSGKLLGIDTATHFGPEFDGMMESLTSSETVTASLVYPIAVFLLQWNYELPDEAFRELLRFRYNDQPSKDRFEEILAVAQGGGPKP